MRSPNGSIELRGAENELFATAIIRDISKRWLAVSIVLALNQTARIVPSRYVAEPNVARQGAEQGNSVSNEHRNARDNETLNEPRTQKPLNRDPTVDVQGVGRH